MSPKQKIEDKLNSALKAKDKNTFPTLRLMISGVPNVGKSTILNGLLGHSKAKAADEPAITKMITRYEVNDELIIYDSPGVMWPKVDTEETGLLLAVNNAIGVNAYNVEDATIFLVEKMLERYPCAIADRYKIEVDENYFNLVESFDVLLATFKLVFS